MESDARGEFMVRIFGFDIGVTSIGFAVVDYEPTRDTGEIIRLGVRIFPEARDPDGAPLNQARRAKRMMRRQLRRRRERRRRLNEALATHGLLPRFGSPEWGGVMQTDPVALRAEGLTRALTPYEFGRSLYHLAKRRHFSGREIEEDTSLEDSADEKAAKSGRESTIRALKASGQTLSEYLAARPQSERKRGVHALRQHVKEEFDRLWRAQERHHPQFREAGFRETLEDIIFSQRPVFWRLNTLGECALEPGAALLPKGGWLSAQRRMLDKLNVLQISGGNARPLDRDERDAILAKLQTQHSMSWASVRTTLEPVFKERGDSAKTLKFNLELGGEPKLLGNSVEAKLADIFDGAWSDHPHKHAIRHAVHARLWSADYGVIGTQRVVIKPAAHRTRDRRTAAETFARDFGATQEQVEKLALMSFPTGWDAFSETAVEKILPELEAGTTLGALLNAPDFEPWRREMFPNRTTQATGEFLDKLPSPAKPDEQKRIASLRNPTVARTQNELRKVTNNLIALYGKPDLIRVELSRDIGLSKEGREDKKKDIRENERRRKEAARHLQANGIAEPYRSDIEKWLLWKECQEKDPYTGDHIGFDDLFRNGAFEVEHIWPRSRSLDDSFRNKTLCRKDVNLAKGNRTPFEYFRGREDEWAQVKVRLQSMTGGKGTPGLKIGKIKRFLAEAIPDDFASRQLNDTGFAGRQAVAFLKRLWPDLGPTAPVTVQTVNGKVTAHLRRLWGLNHILGDTGEKNRGDHRHHAIDALVVACTHQGVTQALSRYWQLRDDPRGAGSEKPILTPPWPTIRHDAERHSDEIIVSHRVRKKVSGPMHKDTVYGDTGEDVVTKSGEYRLFVRRKPVEALSASEYGDIRDPSIREILQAWLAEQGGDPKKISWTRYPKVSEDGPEIRRVRILTKQQINLMAPVSTGYADLGSNHHIAIFRTEAGKVEFEVVSLFEASRRLARRQPVVAREREGCTFVISLASGDSLCFPQGPKAGFWTVTGTWGNGQIVIERTNDALHATTTRPAPGAILKEGGFKVSIDPIGRVRPAND